MPWAVILVHARRGVIWDCLDPSPAEEEERSPSSRQRASRAVLFSCFPPPVTMRLRVRAACFCVEPVSCGAAPAGPSRASPARNHLGSSGAIPARCSRPGQGPGRFPRQGWRLPQLQLSVPRPAPWGCRGPRHPSASPQPQSRAALPRDRLPGRARLDGRGKRCETHLVSPSRSCATRHRVPRDETASSSRTGTVKNSRQKD